MARTRNRYSYDPATGEFTKNGQIYVPSNPSNPISTQYVFSELKKIANSLGIIYQPEDWNDVTFAGSWVNITGGNTQYYIDPFGIVRIRLRAKSGTGAIFTLPSGYRPPEDLYLPADGDAAFAQVNIIASTGVVSLVTGTAVFGVSAEITFRI